LTAQEVTTLATAGAGRLLDPLFRTGEMRAIFSDAHFIECMITFEFALSRALVKTGVAPAAVIPAAEGKALLASLDLGALAEQAGQAGNVAIPFVNALRAIVAKTNPEAAKFVHWGATSQDALDTAVVLQLGEGFAIFEDHLAKLADALAAHAERYKSTILAGRTWLQQGPPITFGLKAAGWLAAIERHRVRLKNTAAQVRVLQFGGAVGTLAALKERGHDVAAALAAELKLELADLPWHSQRDRIAEVATSLGLLTATLGKIARDVSLLMQTEVGEAAEPMAAGRGGSSTMPHKRNPVGCAAVLAAATRVPALVSTILNAMVQEHERALGGWQAEWEVLPEICMLAAGAVSHTQFMVSGLAVDEKQMQKNLEVTHGLIFAEGVAMTLSEKLGRSAAHAKVEELCRRAITNRRHLREEILQDAGIRSHLSDPEIEQLFEPRNYLGSAIAFVERVLARRKKV
jgi:3-carboxy-cis,cis-muconate cycloisomerase